MHFLATHWLHGSIVVIPVIAVVWALGPEVVARRRDRRSGTTATPSSLASRAPLAFRSERSVPLVLVALGTLGAAGVHASVIREHYSEAFLYGFFFTVAAIVQVGYAALVLAWWQRRLLIAGAVGNAAVVVLWAVTRFIAIPFGPDAGSREAVGGRDLTATAFELVAVTAAVVALLQLARAAAKPAFPLVPSQRESSSDPSSNVRLVTKN